MRRLPDDRVFCRAVEHTLSEYGMLQGQKTVLLALSGGKDSVCLFHLLRKLLPARGIRLIAAHVNHGLRGRAADRDEAFCRRLCTEYEIPFRAFFCDVKSYAKEKGLSVEQAARALRYRALLEYAESEKAVLATAHTASDQTETVLMQISRGGGMRASCGIEPVREDGVIRPLLSLTKEETLAFCRAGGYSFVKDHSNRDTDFLRNFYRLRVIPRMKQKNPSLDACVSRFAGIARREHTAFVSLSEARLSELGLFPICARLPLEPILVLAQERRNDAILYLLFSGMLSAAGISGPLSEERFSALLTLLRKEGHRGAFLEIGAGYGFWIEAQTLAVSDAKTPLMIMPLSPGVQTLDSLGCTLRSTAVQKTPPETNVHKIHMIAFLSCDKIIGKLCVRTRRAGDDYRVNGRCRAVKDLFSMRRFPQSLRKDFPLVCDENGPVWIPGELPADRVRAACGERAICVELLSGSAYDELVKRRQYE